MISIAAIAAISAALLPAAQAVAVWGQCGGINYTGSKTCDAGTSCIYVNDYYYQCQPASTTTGRSTVAPTSTKPTSSISSPTGTASCSKAAKKLQYFGVSESCAEFGSGIWPGTLNKDYTWPSPSSVDYFIGKGFNTFRIPFMMERLSPPSTGLKGAFDATYLSGLKTIANYVTSKGGYAVLDPHNYARYNNAIITDYASFQTWWKNLANEFKSNSRIIFDVNNEPNGISASDALAFNQAGVNGIRSSGATTQLILVEGTSWTGAWTWVSSGNGDAFKSIKDPNNNIAIEMHQYLDSDGSGTSSTCVSPTIGAERIASATAWLKSNGFKGFLGEMGSGSNDACVAAVKGLVCALTASDSPWIGGLWWAAGPWWGDYFMSIEPPSGGAVQRILPEALLPFV